MASNGVGHILLPAEQVGTRREASPRVAGTPVRKEAAEATHTLALEFDEETYLTVYQDVAVSIDTGEFATAREHFENFGRREHRLADEPYIRALGLAPANSRSSDDIVFSIDTIVCCASGTALIVGWMDDRDSALISMLVFAGTDQVWNTTSFGRVRRTDAETALRASPGHLFGFWTVVQLGNNLAANTRWQIRARLADGRYAQRETDVDLRSEADLRTTILGFFARAEYYGNRDIESFLALEQGIGATLVALNRTLTTQIVGGAWVSVHGPVRKHYAGSIIVCLYGKHEFLFLQQALFSRAAAARNYEFVFVSNSPELTEALQREARICATIYNMSSVLVCLPDNAGFGAANNAAVQHARSRRLMFTNPDVFPRDDLWAQRHSDIIDTMPPDQTLMFGAPLHYDDGSLMHHGMYFEVDAGTSIHRDKIIERPMIRTEHYGKGAPAWSRQFVCPRPVPAVTGAFISADRAWYERLGGFDEGFLFGHYEDADLCLKSLSAGKPVWMQDFPLWHMEGKGSTRRAEHEGGSLVNRWLFTHRWGDRIVAELNGPDPACAALQPPHAPVAGGRGGKLRAGDAAR